MGCLKLPGGRGCLLIGGIARLRSGRYSRNDGRTPPIVVTRTFELPVAQSILQSMGQVLSQKNTTNTVTRRGDINLSDGGDPF